MTMPSYGLPDKENNTVPAPSAALSVKSIRQFPSLDELPDMMMCAQSLSRRNTASDLPSIKPCNSLAKRCILLVSKTFLKDGAAVANKALSTATVIISSNNVNPRGISQILCKRLVDRNSSCTDAITCQNRRKSEKETTRDDSNFSL